MRSGIHEGLVADDMRGRSNGGSDSLHQRGRQIRTKASVSLHQLEHGCGGDGSGFLAELYILLCHAILHGCLPTGEYSTGNLRLIAYQLLEPMNKKTSSFVHFVL